MTSYSEIIQYLESLSVMPKSMPGLDKIKKALAQTKWFSKIDPKKVIVVAGTNGKGSTCAYLEQLILAAKQKVGFYSSPHLIETTERIRINGKKISQENFINSFNRNLNLIQKHELTHFESLTLMAGEIFFAENNLDYVIFEVGLGGTYDATNAFPHNTSVITSLSLDHTNILGKTLYEIARNKFGIVQDHNKVIHAPFADELLKLEDEIQKKTKSTWISSPKYQLKIQKTEFAPKYILESKWGVAELSLLGDRSAQNANLALTTFSELGYQSEHYLNTLSQVNWPGRMQKISWPEIQSPVYLSGDHNPEGVKSLIQILQDFRYHNLHLVVGIGADKDASEMLSELTQLPRAKLYLTETPFKGLPLANYPDKFLQFATEKNQNVFHLLDQIAMQAASQDLVIVTGSLYLVGKVLAKTKGAP